MQPWSENDIVTVAQSLKDFIGSEEGIAAKTLLRAHSTRLILGDGGILNGQDDVYYLDGRGFRKSVHHALIFISYSEAYNSDDNEISPYQLAAALAQCENRSITLNVANWMRQRLGEVTTGIYKTRYNAPVLT